MALELLERLYPPDLLSLGLTSRDVWSIVQPVLWTNVTGRALAELVPDDLTVLNPRGNTGLEWSRPPHIADYSRIDHYGHFVRGLYIRDEWQTAGPRVLDLFPLLSMHADLNALFPHLRGLRVRLWNGEGNIAPFIPLLLQLPLTYIEVDFTDNHGEADSFIDDEFATDDEATDEVVSHGEENAASTYFLTRFPLKNANVSTGSAAHGSAGRRGEGNRYTRFSRTSFRNICDAIGATGHPVSYLRLQVVLAVEKWADALTEAVWYMVPRIASVRRLTLFIRADLHAFLPIIGTLPLLEELHVDLVSQLEEWQFPVVLEGSFPALQLLHMDYYEATINPPPVEEVLGVVTSTVFSELLCYGPLQCMCKWIRLVAQKWPCTIRALLLDLTEEDQGSRIVTIVDFVKPLFVCSRLRELIIRGGRLHVSHEHIETMTAAWPTMETFAVPTSYPLVLSRTDLELIVRRWPRLRRLHLSVDFDLPPLEMEATRLPSSMLRRFEASYSEMSDVGAVAVFLGSIFPHLQYFDMAWREVDAIHIRDILQVKNEQDNEWRNEWSTIARTCK